MPKEKFWHQCSKKGLLAVGTKIALDWTVPKGLLFGKCHRIGNRHIEM